MASSCATQTSALQRHLVATSSAEVQFEWFTDWMLATGLDEVQGVLKNKALTSNFESRLAMQTAAIRTDDPDTPSLLDQYQGAGERCTSVETIGGTLASKYFARFGVGYHLNNGTTQGQADTSLELVFCPHGKLVGGDTVQLLAPGTGSQYRALTGWIPAYHADKVKAALVILNATANFRCQLAYRTASTSREVTSAWSSNLEGAWHTGNGEFNTGEVALSIGSVFWVQFGVEFCMSAGNNGEATLTASVCARKS